MTNGAIDVPSWQPGERRARVFLSHATVDRPIVEWVAAQVRAVGIDAYVAEEHHQPGRYLDEKVRTAIGESDALLALLTYDAAKSPYVQQEIGAARQIGIDVLALVQKGVDSPSLAMLQGIEHLVFDPDNPAESSAGLVAALCDIAQRRGVPQSPPVMPTQPALQVQLAAQLELTSGQLLVGMLLLAVVAGVLTYAVVRSSGGGAAAAPIGH